MDRPALRRLTIKISTLATNGVKFATSIYLLMCRGIAIDGLLVSRHHPGHLPEATTMLGVENDLISCRRTTLYLGAGKLGHSSSTHEKQNLPDR
jgi:hypothetical protein